MIDPRRVMETMEEMVISILTDFRNHKAERIAQTKKYGLILEQQMLKIHDCDYVDNLESARKNLDKLVEAVEHKVNNGVLFSEAAVKELNFLFLGLITYLNHINDYVTTGNKVLQEHVQQGVENYTKCARDFATKHEERLIKGICQPRSSTVYLNMLESISSIFYNLGKIVTR